PRGFPDRLEIARRRQRVHCAKLQLSTSSQSSGHVHVAMKKLTERSGVRRLRTEITPLDLGLLSPLRDFQGLRSRGYRHEPCIPMFCIYSSPVHNHRTSVVPADYPGSGTSLTIGSSTLFSHYRARRRGCQSPRLMPNLRMLRACNAIHVALDRPHGITTMLFLVCSRRRKAAGSGAAPWRHATRKSSKSLASSCLLLPSLLASPFMCSHLLNSERLPAAMHKANYLFRSTILEWAQEKRWLSADGLKIGPYTVDEALDAAES
ncbi:hypothetical protein K466DRAFT_571162, partial [Polyporus arcularius HHB13444]